MKTISIFGSTGSIGKKMVNAVESNPDFFKVVCLTCRNNIKLIIRQACILKPEYVVVAGEYEDYQKVNDELCHLKIKTLPKEELCQAASIDVDIMGMAISGTSGMLPSFSCLGHAKTLAIANKETIVSGGKLFREKAEKLGTSVVPVDSEHNGIYQCLVDRSIEDVKKITVTCSGGPFIDYPKEQLEKVTVEQALNHPNWEMGKKNTIDSATLMNKVLEIIEAANLFTHGEIEKVDSIIHRESIIHALVHFKDSSVIAMMSVPDMQIPVNYALLQKYYDNALVLPESLTFRKFKGWQEEHIRIAYDVYKEKKCIAFNVANEMAVTKFLKKEIQFLGIIGYIKKSLNKAEGEDVKSIEEILEIEKYCHENF